MKILLVDNYDSFTYNLYHLIKKVIQQQGDIEIIQNNKIDLHNIDKYDKIILSPGPGLPHEAPQLLPLIDMYAKTDSILGICLGHQALAQYFGGKLLSLAHPIHGGCSEVQISQNSILFRGFPSHFKVARYHSWYVEKDTLPHCLRCTASAEGLIMAIEHISLPLFGVQFHPESFCTEFGELLISNFLF